MMRGRQHPASAFGALRCPSYLITGVLVVTRGLKLDELILIQLTVFTRLLRPSLPAQMVRFLVAYLQHGSANVATVHV